MSTPSAAQQSGAGRIVVGVDGSASSEEALPWALGRARLNGQPVEAIISWDIPVDFRTGALSVYDWEGDATSTLKDTVAEVVGSSSADRVSQRVVRGHPAPVLLDAAAGASMLVVGSRGHGGFAGMLLGSVSQHVVAQARCPVVVVGDPSKPPA